MKAFLSIMLAILWGLCLSTPTLAATKIKAVVDKSDQRMYVYDDEGEMLYSFCASTGKVSTYSRVGTFHPQSFRPGKHYSGSYGGSMINSVYYDGARAVHGVEEPENIKALCHYGTSYGCTHLSIGDAKIFFDLAAKYKPSEVEIIIQQ